MKQDQLQQVAPEEELLGFHYEHLLGKVAAQEHENRLRRIAGVGDDGWCDANGVETAQGVNGDLEEAVAAQKRPEMQKREAEEKLERVCHVVDGVKHMQIITVSLDEKSATAHHGRKNFEDYVKQSYIVGCSPSAQRRASLTQCGGW